MSTDDRMETITDPAAIRATDEPDERGDFPCCATPTPVGAAVALDLDAIEARQKAAASARWEIIGDRDGPRALMALLGEDVPALVAEVRRLTVEAATQREWFEAADAAADRRLDQSIAWMERAEAAEAEVRRLTESRATVAANLSASLMLADAEVVTLRAKVAEAEAKRDEFADLLARALPAVAALARVEALCDSNPDHADTCGSMLTPGAGYPCSCWQADLRAALATTGEGQ